MRVFFILKGFKFCLFFSFFNGSFFRVFYHPVIVLPDVIIEPQEKWESVDKVVSLPHKVHKDYHQNSVGNQPIGIVGRFVPRDNVVDDETKHDNDPVQPRFTEQSQ